MDLTASIVLEEWLNVKAKFDAIKEQELALRKTICADILQGKIGTKTTHIDGYKITASDKLNVKLDEAALDTVWEALSDIEKDCIKFKPALQMAKYNKLDKEVHDTLIEAIVTSPATPTLKVVKED